MRRKGSSATYFYECAHVSNIVTEANHTTVLFVYQGVVSRLKKLLKTDFPLDGYHIKIRTFIKKQNAMAYGVSRKDSI